MKVYNLDKARGRSIIEVDGGLLWPTKSLVAFGETRLGEPLPKGFAGLKARVFFQDGSPYPLPEIASSQFISTFSERAKELVDSFPDVDASWIPLKFVGAARKFRNLDWAPCSLEDSRIDVNGRYFAIHLNKYSDVLDKNLTLMSREYILDPAIPPGNYLRIVFRRDIQLPPLFVLPGGTFGILASEDLFKSARKQGISGVGRRSIFNLDQLIESDALQSTKKEFIVSMKDAWEIFENLNGLGNHR